MPLRLNRDIKKHCDDEAFNAAMDCDAEAFNAAMDCDAEGGVATM